VTLVALVCALAGGLVVSRGGYLAGVVGMFLVELGSIIDGIDGELARLRFQFSRGGQWLDTVVDDIANVAYASGVIVSLTAAGATWAVPVGVPAIIAFVMTQSTQYALIRFVYKSGDLAAIPWAFQSAEFLSQRPKGFRAWVAATLPKTLKRDFVVTMFLVFALLGRLEPILLVFAGGAFVFFLVFFVQFARNFDSVRRGA
jgi:1L-myo-inositol 1-phosphate cytidylyltransferase / CDP-L-myo-inositol myo-inositolphosphotransferase